MKNGIQTFGFNLYEITNMYENTKEKLENIRNWSIRCRREITFALIIFLVATLSFGLGYLSNREFNHAPIIIQKAAEN